MYFRGKSLLTSCREMRFSTVCLLTESNSGKIMRSRNMRSQIKVQPKHHHSFDVWLLTTQANTTWRAGKNKRFSDALSAKSQMGSLFNPIGSMLPTKSFHLSSMQKAALPSEFDARIAWPDCPTIGEIRDQGACGSCWVSSQRFILPPNCVRRRVHTYNFST